MKTNQHLINIGSDFSTAPGPRLIKEGKCSGEEFRKNTLYPKLAKAIEEGAQLIVVLDGTSGFGTSFLEEAFGGLIRENNLTLSCIEKHLLIVSEEDPDYLEEIELYLKDAEDEE
ncbi:MAG: STAS-like domain-containing protein [Opitutales bacterium]|nr:STAS-like domain-containing protein [Opitutales bacterium]